MGVNFSPLLQHAHVFGILQEVGGEYEVVQALILAENDLLITAFPFLFPLVHVKDVMANLHHTVHVVGIDHRGHVVFYGDVADEFVDDQ